MKANSSTSKLQVVFNAKSFGSSLNEILHVGLKRVREIQVNLNLK